MRTIVMDTSNHYLAIALYEDGLLRACRQLEALKQQSACYSGIKGFDGRTALANEGY